MSTEQAPNSASAEAAHAQTPLQIVKHYETVDVAEHGFFKSLKQQPFDYSAVWVLIANLQITISDRFIRWLADVISRVDNLQIAGIFAKQLNDELAEGRADNHIALLTRFVAGLSPWRPDSAQVAMLAPGHRLLANLSEIYDREDPYNGVGALMTTEIFAKKFDISLGTEIRRQSQLSAETLAWLTIHEHLELGHAEDSYALAELAPLSGPHATALRAGAHEAWEAMWKFLDEVHETYVDWRRSTAA